MSSRTVQVGVLGTLSMSLAACGGGSWTASCVDGYNGSRAANQYRVVSDGLCDNGGQGGRYFWYYNGSVSGGYAHRGTTLKPKKGSITTHSGRTLRRGGFGSSSHSSSHHSSSHHSGG